MRKISVKKLLISGNDVIEYREFTKSIDLDKIKVKQYFTIDKILNAWIKESENKDVWYITSESIR